MEWFTDPSWVGREFGGPVALTVGLLIFFGGLLFIWWFCSFIVGAEEQMFDAMQEAWGAKEDDFRNAVEMFITTTLWLVLWPTSFLIRGLLAVAGLYALLEGAKSIKEYLD